MPPPPRASSSSSYFCNGSEWVRVKVLGKGSFGEAILVQRRLLQSGGGVEGLARSTNASSSSSSQKTLAVVKVVNTLSMTSAEKRDAQKEVSVLSKLSHPNIVGFIGSSEADGQLHIFMEYCNSGDLEGLLKRQKGVYMAEDTIASIFIQAAAGIQYLHERRILHRDLKSQNLFLTQKSPTSPLLVKIGDFGISTVLKNTMALAKTICGTPYYFSPELCLNRPYNNKTDVWSLGIILYEMACLKYPFDAASMKGLMQRILQGRWAPLPPQYSPSMSSLIDGMLQQRVDQRHAIGRVMTSTFVRHHTERMRSLLLSVSSSSAAASSPTMVVGSPTRPQPSSSAPRTGDAQKAVIDPRGACSPSAEGGGSGGDGVILRPMPGLSPGRGVPLTVDASAPASPSSPLPPTSKPRSAAGGGEGVAVDKHAKALLRRVAMEKEAMEKRRAIEEQRQRRNIRAAQQYDQARDERQRLQRRQELERLDDVRRRIEMCSWEDQQRYLEEGWRVVNATRERQAERGKWHEDTDHQVEEIRRQMEAIDVKLKERRQQRKESLPMNNGLFGGEDVGDARLSEEAFDTTVSSSPPPTAPPTARELANMYRNRVSPEAPWNRNRAAPVGFTRDSWEKHQRVEALAALHSSPGLVQQQKPPPMPMSRGTEGDAGKTVERRGVGGGDIVESLDVEAFLEKEAALLALHDPAFREAQRKRAEEKAAEAAAMEWEAHKQRIRDAAQQSEAITPSPPPPPPHFLPVGEVITVVDNATNGALVDDEYVAVLNAMREGGGGEGTEEETFGDEGWSAVDAAEEEAIRKLYDANLPSPPTTPSPSTAPPSQTPSPPPRPRMRVEKVRAAHDDDAVTKHVGGKANPPPQQQQQQRSGNNALTSQTPLTPLPPPPPDSTSRVTMEATPPRNVSDDAKKAGGEDTSSSSSSPPRSLDVFMLNGRELRLPGIDPNTSTPLEKVKALQSFLSDRLGGPRSFRKLRHDLEAIQNAPIDEGAAMSMLTRLQRQYGAEGEGLVDLMMQLIVMEGLL